MGGGEAGDPEMMSWSIVFGAKSFDFFFFFCIKLSQNSLLFKASEGQNEKEKGMFGFYWNVYISLERLEDFELQKNFNFFFFLFVPFLDQDMFQSCKCFRMVGSGKPIPAQSCLPTSPGSGETDSILNGHAGGLSLTVPSPGERNSRHFSTSCLHLTSFTWHPLLKLIWIPPV